MKPQRFVFRSIAVALALVASGFVSLETYAEIHYVQEMTANDLASLDREKTAVILPGGILEQHGPYLPSFTDGYMNEAMTQALSEAISSHAGWDALVFPLIPLGAGGANELGGKYVFSGTYAVRFETLRAIFMDLATELGEQGFRTIFVMHIHGAPNHNKALNQACDYFHDTYNGDMVNLFGRILPGGQGDLRTREEAREDGPSM